MGRTTRSADARLHRFFNFAETPLFRHASHAIFRASPPPIRTWLRMKRLQSKKASGFELVPERELTRVYRNSLQWLLAQGGPSAVGDYLEFGVFYGASLTCMHRVLNEFGLSHVRLFGFDSWQGLPEHHAAEDGGLWNAGDFRVDYETARAYMTTQSVDWNRVHLIRGWYSDTLVPELAERYKIRRASVVMIDCDLYSSSSAALAFCAPFLGDSAVLMFDDWFAGELAQRNMGEKKAFSEFLTANPYLECEEAETYTAAAKVFRVTRKRVHVPVTAPSVAATPMASRTTA